MEDSNPEVLIELPKQANDAEEEEEEGKATFLYFSHLFTRLCKFHGSLVSTATNAYTIFPWNLYLCVHNLL